MPRIIIIAVILFSLIAAAYIAYSSINKPSKVVESGVEINKEFVNVIFKEGTDITQFAKKYNIDVTKIEGPSRAGVYKILVLQERGLLSTTELFEKDPDVVTVQWEIYDKLIL